MRYRPALVIAAATGVVAAGAGGASSLVSPRSPRSGAPVPVEDARASPIPEPPAALFTAHVGPVTPGAPPQGLSGTAPGDCATCHAEIAAEWAGSAHARSWTDPIFQAEYRLSREAFCRRCHAPLLPDAPAHSAATAAEATAAADASPEAPAARGIDCAVCHVRIGHVLGVRGRGADDHAALRDARLATGAFCGSCHQFDFRAAEPGERLRYQPGRPLQDTLAEWSRSSYADQPCQHCHMPLAGPPGRQHRSHAFRTLDDPDAMARAVRVTARAERRGGTIRAAFELAPGEIGHAFPTGDMFRRAVLTVSAGTARTRKVLRRYFAQTITADGRGHLLGQVDDTRVPPPGAGPARRFDLELDDPRAAEVTWSLELFRLDPEEARRRGLDEAVIGIPVRSGRIAITSPARAE